MHLGLWHLLLCLSLLSTRADSDVTLRFLSEPLSTVQKPGSVVTLLCSAESPQLHISWLFNEKLLDRRQSQDVAIQSGHLTIPALTPQYVGRYQCMMNSSAGSIISAPAVVSMAYLEDFANSSKVTLVAEEGSSVIINCSTPRSAPHAEMHYKVKGKWLDRSTDKYLILPSGNLQIFSVSLEDRGPYKCAAYNPMTHERKISPSVYKLSISDRPQEDASVMHPVVTHKLSVYLHDSVTLECAGGGASDLNIQWYKDGNNAMADDRRKLWYTHLVIEDVEALDGGNYSCQVGATTSVNYTVAILERPSIYQPPEDQSVVLGSDVSFICEAQGIPSPNITWLHNSKTVSPSSRLRPLGSKLHIANVMGEDSGMYQCMADNGVGAVQSAARLRVQSESGSRPTIVLPPTSVSVVIGDWVTLTCNATGHPTPFIRWFDSNGAISSHPSQILRPKPRKASQSRTSVSSNQDPAHVIMSQAGSSSLYIPAVTVQHAGKYVCEASNQFGWTRAEATLTVVPYDMSTIRSVLPVTPGGSRSEDAIPTSAVPTEKPVNVAMLPDAPIILSPPQATKPDTYFLVWRSGRDGGLPINAYFVRYRKLDDDGNVAGSWHSIRVPASENEFSLSELEPSSLYEVLMVARNAAGEGQPAMLTFRTSKEKSSSSKNTQAPSPPIGRRHQDILQENFNSNFGLVHDSFRHSSVPEAPDRPTIFIASESSVFVTWIPRANGGSPITSFKVEYKKAGRPWMTAADNIHPSKLSVEVSSLEPGAVYKFRVIAINTYGESRRSTVSRPYQVPGYISRLPNPLIIGPHIDHTEAVTDTQIMLKWTYTPANNNNTPIQGFYIYYRPTDSDNDSDYKREVVEGELWGQLRGTKQRHLISHLQPETSYDIKMQCFNERGASDYSNVMMCETKARRSPGASEYPVLELSTPAVVKRVEMGSSSSSSTPARSGDMLYVIVGCVLGGMVLILMVFIAICLLKHRQQSLLHKFEPPGYLYQGSDLNGQMIEYTTLPGTSLINGNIHGGYMGNGTITNGCPHMHHNVHNGMNGIINGELYPNCLNSLKSCPDYEHFPHSTSNGGVIYSSVPQVDPSECQKCRNCCNNNRCFNKISDSYISNGTARAPYQEVAQEGKPLSSVSVPMNLTAGEPECTPELEGDLKEEDVPTHHDGVQEIKAMSHEGDGCSSTKEECIRSPTPPVLPIVLNNCDENKTRTLENSTNDLHQQLPMPEE
ncbi:cell adhesion molecule-related/down-regulated by oncogenes isoform X1 [Bufo gargarizans]|uniref:cell adhesion molecule-related/down-regulated by oncogenes isoform X1 n=1 Tax=Bufo gargarizans TaxID=30331 RepID=UPI001CF34993|nr:cell adhesion molecule-related/down-regulated by oncogenes isoform X1 [Bufo gargarizans]XP_044137934.1 cell adhesion molecule-related/down-regulated by oncogenes isoform X1 [Bufo gargarizans]XP_044137935.1 cell adhesion molecule-related/down-regulated by oncogenes isoform X1 [Bufo gargarizans]XP_044137936.1 cell adhesion molecule-related/down-regulated by oncogenes isoform X1 [Bufo gargarizans]XP_044137937.1 cell adhesion molecule-related/down-regulated by oncogenes isoform X1 [Bufo gargariz